MNTLNIENLLNALSTTFEIRYGKDNVRAMRNFCKKIGVNIYNKMPFITKSQKNATFCPSCYNKYYIEVYKKSQKNNIFKYDNFEFSFTDSFDIDKNKNISAKIQSIKGEKELNEIPSIIKSLTKNDFKNLIL